MENRKDKTIIFEKYPIPKAFLALCIPTIISQLIAIIYNFSDTWFLGRIGEGSETAVAALGIIMPVYVIMAAIANLFGVGGASVIARFLGKGERIKARSAFVISVYSGIAFALLYALILIIFHEPLIRLVGGTEETYSLIFNYMIITMIIGALPSIMNQLFGHLVRSVGAAFQSSIGMSLGVILNIILDPLFMFIIIKDNPLVGAAVATLISNIIASLYFIIYILLTKKNISTYSLNPKEFTFKEGILKEIVSIGFPAALATTLAMVSNIFANVLVNKPTNISAVAGLNIAKKANTLAFHSLMGTTQGMLPFIAYNYASKNHQRRRDGIKAMYIVAVGFALIMLFLYLLFREPLMRFFLPKDEEAVKYGSSFLAILAFAVPLCAISYSTNTIFQATGNKVFSFILSILRKGVFDIPLMYVLKYLTELDLNGVIVATPIAELGSAFIAIILLLILNKKNKKLIKEEEQNGRNDQEVN